MSGPGLRRRNEKGDRGPDDLQRLRGLPGRLPAAGDPAQGGTAMSGQQLIISGVGGQGILFITRLLAETAIAKGLPVLTSETHGMPPRGGIVVSHLKVGGFASPLVRPGRADGLLALKAETVPL